MLPPLSQLGRLADCRLEVDIGQRRRERGNATKGARDPLDRDDAAKGPLNVLYARCKHGELDALRRGVGYDQHAAGGLRALLVGCGHDVVRANDHAEHVHVRPGGELRNGRDGHKREVVNGQAAVVVRLAHVLHAKLGELHLVDGPRRAVPFLVLELDGRAGEREAVRGVYAQASDEPVDAFEGADLQVARVVGHNHARPAALTIVVLPRAVPQLHEPRPNLARVTIALRIDVHDANDPLRGIDRLGRVRVGRCASRDRRRRERRRRPRGQRHR